MKIFFVVAVLFVVYAQGLPEVYDPNVGAYLAIDPPGPVHPGPGPDRPHVMIDPPAPCPHNAPRDAAGYCPYELSGIAPY